MICTIKRKFKIKKSLWYLEYHSGIRIHFYFSFMIAMFPVVVICKFDDPHDTVDWKEFVISFLIFEYSVFYKEK